jgi:hypothetical protein
VTTRQQALWAATASVICPVVAVIVRFASGTAYIESTRLIDFLVFLPLAVGGMCAIKALQWTRSWQVRRLGIVGAVICIPYALMMLAVMVLGLR